MEISGKIHLVRETQQVSDSFKKRQLVVATNEQYIQYISIDFVQDKCDILNNYSIGDDVKVSINIRGNEHNGNYYSSIQGWRIEKTSTF